MTFKETFIPCEEHFNLLVQHLDPDELYLYRRTKHVRVEDAFRGRTFYVYEIEDRSPKVLDIITVEDFMCNERTGASTELRNRAGDTLTVGYEPIQLFGHEVFVHLPLHMRVRWSTVRSKPLAGSLAFPICVRTMSRLHPRERGVQHCETGVEYAKEFETDSK
jgi:hypothetical protein